MKFNKSFFYPFYLLLFVLLSSATLFIDACKSPSGRKEYAFTKNPIADGKALVAQNCVRCHQLVEPGMLTKDIWKYHSLPSMAKYFGIQTYGVSYYQDNTDSAKLTLREWQAIANYYDLVAPVEMSKATPPAPLVSDWAGFSLKKPDTLKGPSVFTSMITADPVTHKIYTADALSKKVTEWDQNLKPTPFTELLTPGAQMDFIKDADGKRKGVISAIGQMEPINFPNGRVIKIDLEGESKGKQVLVASELSRPVQTLSADFNKDGLDDIVICSNAPRSGDVYLMTQGKDHEYTQSVVLKKHGAVQATIGDYNNDGWPDLMVLYGVDNEGLWLFTNDHKGGFTPKEIMHFPPVYGSTSFQLVDLNHDGKLDLIYTCGYNYYDSRILKPYHGLYVFTNQGDWNFKQSYFYPIDGCTKAIAADFDGDGNMDIATSAFFANLKGNPAEGVVYFEHDNKLTFKPHAIPVSQYGRWYSMAVGDYNNDGRPDILLGNYSHGFAFQKGLKPFWSSSLPFIVLENNLKK